MHVSKNAAGILSPVHAAAMESFNAHNPGSGPTESDKKKGKQGFEGTHIGQRFGSSDYPFSQSDLASSASAGNKETPVGTLLLNNGLDTAFQEAPTALRDRCIGVPASLSAWLSSLFEIR